MNANAMALKPDAAVAKRDLTPFLLTRRPWTATEIAVLHAHYLSGGAAACLPKLPGRDLKGIYRKAISQGLRRQKEHTATQESTEWIDAQVRRHYSDAPKLGAATALAKRLGVTRQWLSTRAATLGVLPVTRPGSNWTPEEDALLEQYATSRADRIAKIFRAHGYHRTAGAIGERLSRSDLDRLDPDIFSVAGLARCMGIDSHKPLRWIESGRLRAKKIGQGRTGAWEIRRNDLREFLVKSADWDHRRCPREWLVDILAGGH